MIPWPIVRQAGVAALAMLLASSTTPASTASSDNTQSTCTDCTFLIDWNPTLECTEPFTDGADLQNCVLLSGPPGCGSHPIEEVETPDPIGGGTFPEDIEQNPPSGEGCVVPHETGNYIVFPFPPPFGLEILREDLTEIERLHFLEDYPEITWVEIHVPQPGLAARIGEITGTPSFGQIRLTLNGRLVEVVETVFEQDANDVTEAVVKAIRDARFTVRHVSPYIEVTWDEFLRTGVTHVRLESTDPGIVRNEVALEPRAWLNVPIRGGSDSGP